MPQNAQIAAELGTIADLLELTGANPFRVRAYNNASRTIETLDQEIAELVAQESDLTELPGIGKDLAQQLTQRVQGTPFALLQELNKTVPSGLHQVVRVQGLGPKKVRTLWTELGIEDLDALEKAAKAGEIEKLKGFGATMQEKILSGVDAARRHQERMRRADAEPTVNALVTWLEQERTAERVAVAGSFRRGRDTIGDLDIIVVTHDDASVMQHLKAYEGVQEVLWSGPQKTSVVVTNGLQVDVRTVEPRSFGAAMNYFTGSKAHNVHLRQRAIERSLSLNEYGLWRDDGETMVAGETEAELYKALGLTYTPPELREDRGEIEAAEANNLPTLIDEGNVHADLHMHTDWSDGQTDLATMLSEQAARGRTVVAITDHSPALKMTRGLDRDKLLRQWDAIDALDVPEGMTVLKGMEVDILKDGTLDMDDDMLARMDVVVASVHSHFDLDENAQTERLERALSHGSVRIFGHPTGRLLGKRDGIRFDRTRVLKACRDNRVAIEINAHPARLDADDVLARQAAKTGLKISINTDAHTVSDLDLMRHGVLQARRAWLTKEDVINTWSTPDLLAFLQRD